MKNFEKALCMKMFKMRFLQKQKNWQKNSTKRKWKIYDRMPIQQNAVHLLK